MSEIISHTDDASENYSYTNTKQKPSNSTVSQHNYGSSGNGNNQTDDHFQTGDFIVSRQDIFHDWPAIWRVDSKTLLQKFEPFHTNNKTIYRSLSTVGIPICISSNTISLNEIELNNTINFQHIQLILVENVQILLISITNLHLVSYIVCAMESRKSSFLCTHKMYTHWAATT